MASQQGFCEAILLHLDTIAGVNYPGKKVTNIGFTQMLLEQPRAYTTIQDGYAGGHTRAVNIKYATRGTIAQVSTSNSCAVDVQPLFKETTASINNTVSQGIWIPDSQMRQYCEDASRTVAVGQPPTPMMVQFLDFVLHQINSLYQKQESVLTTEMASTFGKHKATGSAAAVAVNIEQDGNLNDLTAGVLKMLVDARANEFCGTPRFVGALGGLMDAYDMQYRMRGLSAGVGLDNRSLLDNAAFKFYGSGLAGTTWGSTNVGMFSEDSVHYLEYLENVGNWAGTRGNSTFSTFIDPRVQCWAEGGMLGNVTWDMQVRYADCPEDVGNFITSGYKNVNTISGRGYLVRIYKQYDLFVTPTDAYDGADVLAGSNGTLRYSLTNT
jgi:hypothetical protein